MTDVPALETFVAVARAGSVVGAAERLARTQPSISARLLALESAWATKLFRRHARGMTLTPEGARLLPLAEAALQSLGALDRAAGLPVSGPDELRIGAGDALGREVVPRAMARLLGKRPSLSIRVLEGPAPRLLEALRAGEIDLALAVDVVGEAAGVSFEPLLSSPVEVLARGGELTAREVPLQSLRDRRLVTLQRGSGFRGHLEDAFGAAGVPFRPAVEVGNLSLVRRFVAAGLGVAPVPAIAFARDLGDRGLVRRRLLGVPPVSYALARRAGVPLTGAAEQFVALLRRGQRGLADKSPQFGNVG
jgi:LysR family hydrogen peroxide-inducible transcriptional activator